MTADLATWLTTASATRTSTRKRLPGMLSATRRKVATFASGASSESAWSTPSWVLMR